MLFLFVQAISAQDEKLAQTMFLPLAERMVEKMVKEEKIEAEAEVSKVSAWPEGFMLCYLGLYLNTLNTDSVLDVFRYAVLLKALHLV